MGNVRDKSWLSTVFMEWATWAFLWWSGDSFTNKFKHDVLSEELKKTA